MAHRIRLDPNNRQASWLARAAGTARFAYNWGLARWQELYEAGERPSGYTLSRELTALKGGDFAWMDVAPRKVTDAALADLQAAFEGFFRRIKGGGRPGYPRFKKKGRCREGFALDARWIRLDGCRLRIPKLGWVRMRQEVRFPGRVVSARVTKRADHWCVSFQIEVDESAWTYPHRCETQAAVGVDLGLCDLAVLSDGSRVEAPRALRKAEKRLRRLNKELHRRKKGGRNREKTKRKLARLHERIANIRRDTTHKLTVRIVRNYRSVVVEDLSVAGMKHSGLAKSVSDAAMAEVRRQFAYKAPLAGSTVIEAGRWFPSSKTCSDCGATVKSLPRSTREWTCPTCGVIHDRDVNAAVNLKNLAAAHAVTAHCQESAGAPRGVQLSFGWEAGCYGVS